MVSANQIKSIKFICDKKEHNATQKNKANVIGSAIYGRFRSTYTLLRSYDGRD